MKAEKIFVTYGFAVGANFLVFWTGAVALGGDAANGYSSAGRYFLCAHGGCREVSKALFTYSWWHAAITMASFAMLLVAAVILEMRENSN